MLAMQFVIILMLQFYLIHTVKSIDIGYDLLYTDNPNEYRNIKLNLSKPLPQGLTGLLLRNGMGQYSMGHRNVSLVFDGFAKISKWNFTEDNQVSFSSAFAATASWNDSVSRGDIAPYLILRQPTPKFNRYQRMKQLFNGYDNPNINIVKFNSTFVALMDSWKIYTFNENNLDQFEGFFPELPRSWLPSLLLSKCAISCAHPIPIPGTTDWINFHTSVSVEGGSNIHIARITSASKRTFLTEIHIDSFTYMHSFGATEHYVIFILHPLYISVERMMEYASGNALVWDPSMNGQLCVVDLRNGQKHMFDIPTRFVTHHVNAFEITNDVIVADFITYPDPTVLLDYTLDVARDPHQRNNLQVDKAQLQRYAVNLAKGVVTVQTFPGKFPFSSNFDFPVINEQYRMRDYCFVYGIVNKADKKHLSDVRLIKKDLCGSGAKDLVWSKANHYPGEPWFVAAPGGQAEDDGYLLDVILDGAAGKSYLAIFDARTMELISTAYGPSHIPYQLHGRFFPN
jgi:carotenoid cleavage dioxygenase-like enzyme